MNFDFESGLMGQLSIVSTTGKLYMPPQTDKDNIHDAITWSIYPDFAKQRKIGKHKSKGQVRLDNPIFVLWTAIDNAERNSIKFSRMIGQVENIMGLEPTIAHPVDTGIGSSAAPFVAAADSWWLKSPVSISAYLLLLRLTVAMRFDEPLDIFIDRMISLKNHKKYTLQRDAKYLRKAQKKGNLDGLLRKSLPCLNRDNYSDYLLSNHGRGFSSYSKDKDTKLDPYEQVQSKNLKKLKKQAATSKGWLYGISALDLF